MEYIKKGKQFIKPLLLTLKLEFGVTSVLVKKKNITGNKTF